MVFYCLGIFGELGLLGFKGDKGYMGFFGFFGDKGFLGKWCYKNWFLFEFFSVFGLYCDLEIWLMERNM